MTDRRQSTSVERRAKADWLIYLAGPITGISFEEATRWRKVVSAAMPSYIETASPLRGKGEYLSGVQELQESYDHGDTPMSSSDGIFLRDTFDVMRCDLVLVNFIGARRPSLGTVSEMTLAWREKKPVIVAVEEDDVHHRNHPFVRETSSKMFPTLKAATEFAVHLLSTGEIIKPVWPDGFDM